MIADPHHHRHGRTEAPVRVAVIREDFGLLGGAEKFAYELTRRIAACSNVDVHLLANKWTDPPDGIVAHKIPILPFPRWLRPVSFAWFVQRAVTRGGYDIVHSHDRVFSFDFLTHHGLPHELWIREVRKKRLSLFDRATAWVEKAGIQASEDALILPVSRFSRDGLKRCFAIPDRRFRLIYPAISLDRFHELDRLECRRKIRRKYNIEDADTLLLFVGMNFENKGLERVLKGMSAFTAGGRDHPRLKLLVVGKGDIKRYQQTAGELGVDRRVVFTGAVLPVEPIFMAADIFVLLSHMEPFGIVVLEAMAAGLPVLVSETVGAADVLTHGEEGFILSEKNLESDMCHALSALMDDAVRENMAEHSRDTVKAHDWDERAAQVLTLYREQLRSKGTEASFAARL
jgi:UDP-glucose:(heptosyl)LPS alpha-1,3-glucosyltransferase